MPSPRAGSPRRGGLQPLRLCLTLVLLLNALVHAGAATAQVPVPQAAAPPPTGEQAVAEVEALIQELQDPAARDELVQDLELLVEARQGDAPARANATGATAEALKQIGGNLATLSNELVVAAAALEDLPAITNWLTEQWREPDRRSLWLAVLGNLALTIGLGYGAQVLMRLALLHARRRLAQRPPRQRWLRLPLLAAIALLDLVPVAAFAAVALGTLTWLDPRPDTRLVALAWIHAVILVQLVLLLARGLFAAAAPALRLVPMSDREARRGERWTGRFARVGLFGFFAIQAAGLLGLPDSGLHALLRVLGFALLLLAIAFVIRVRKPIGRWIRGRADAEGTSDEAREANALSDLRARAAAIWYVPALLYLVTIYGIWALQAIDGAERLLWGTLLTVVTIVVAVAVGRLADRAICVALSPDGERRPLRRRLRRQLRRWQTPLRFVTRWAVRVVALLLILQAWGVPSFAWLAAEPGRTIAVSTGSVLLTLLLALAVWEGATLGIASYLAEHDDQAGRAPLRSARTRTLLAVARTALLVLLSVVTALILLSELGIDIAPMLAAAGVLGLAVGFGSQKLIQDLITGFFILLEDIFSVGDVVKVGDTAGLVEAVSIRNVRLRDLSGTVHTIPFSTIDRISNLTKEFSFHLFDLGVAYRENVDDVIAVLREIGAEMRADDYFGALILDDLEIFGLDAFADSAVVIKGRIKTQPIKQWEVGRELNRRVKARFDALGIEIPFPHRTLYFGAGKDGSAPPARIEELASSRPAGESGQLASPDLAAPDPKPATS